MQVEVSCTARIPSSSGRPGQGQTYFSTQPGQPLQWVVGSGKVCSPVATVCICPRLGSFDLSDDLVSPGSTLGYSESLLGS